MKKQNVAVLGATGAVGEEILNMLVERAFPLGELRLLASPRSAGQKKVVDGKEYVIEAVSEDSFENIDIAFFCAGGSVSEKYAKHAVKAGAVVIDNTSAFRLKPDIPLVVPEVNGEDILKHQGIIANPNCSTTIMAVALAPIHKKAQIKRVVVSTYQAVSGAGFAGMQELEQQVRDYVADKPMEANVLPVASGEKHYPIAFNAIPQIDVFEEGDYTKEEWKMIKETQKIFNEPLRITATTVRLPIMRSHCESINVETELPLSPEECKELLRQAPGIEVLDEVAEQQYPMPIFTSGKDPVYVGRIRKDFSVKNGINLWVVGDQIRKGAALNAIQIAEFLTQNLG
ncbi:MAG: aspartate-semialdehyde dehydrogenase [Firmicutes bacterium]|nr:aspartate-semialdehyde dehydrogenase [Bacillota bacterium]